MRQWYRRGRAIDKRFVIIQYNLIIQHVLNNNRD